MHALRRSPGFRIYIWVITLSLSCIILFIFTSSITPAGELFKSPVDYIPKHPTFDNYQQLIQNSGLASKLGYTMVISFSAMFLNLIICLMAAYGFSRHKSRGLSIAFALIIFSIMVPAVVKARPLFTFIRAVGLYDTVPGLIILYTSNLIPFSMIILSNFLNDIPMAIDEAAEIDGVTTLQKLMFIIFPLMKPAIATILMINFIICLNELFTPLFYASRIQTLSVAITTLPSVDGYSIPWELVSSMGCVIILPIIIFVSIFERQIMDGIMAGGVKA